MKNFLIFLSITICLMIIPVISVFSQPPPPPPQAIPLDGGVIGLILSGVFLIIRKFYKSNKQ